MIVAGGGGGGWGGVRVRATSDSEKCLLLLKVVFVDFQRQVVEMI